MPKKSAVKKEVKDKDPIDNIMDMLDQYYEGTEVVSAAHEYTCFCGKEGDNHTFRSRDLNSKPKLPELKKDE